MYEFLSLNFDIAHYDKGGFTYEYDNSWEDWYRRQVVKCREFDRIPQWRTDLRRIIDEFQEYRLSGGTKKAKETVKPKKKEASPKKTVASFGQYSIWDIAV